MRADARHQRDEHRGVHPLFVAEVVIQRGLGHADRLGDISNRDRREATLHEEALRLAQDQLACLDDAL